MKLTLRYFASIREALGPGEEVSVAETAKVAEVRTTLIARGGRYAEVLAYDKALRCALNQTLCSEADPVSDGDELAFFPPVTGG